MLESNTIAAEVRNDTLHSAQGGIPINEANPVVWVVNDSDEETALRIIKEQADASLGDDDTRQTPAERFHN